MPEVNDILRGWQTWGVPWSTQPRLERELTGGRTNRSYLISADERHWVLRLNAQNFAEFGIDRKREAAVIECAAAAGLAPAIAYCSIERGILLTEFIGGRHWQAHALDDRENRLKLINLIESVHRLEFNAAPIDYYAHAENYWARLIEARIDIPHAIYRERERLLKHRTVSRLKNSATRLCHHDLNPSNVIDNNGRLYLVDWEYAACGSPAFDYAAIGVEWSLPVAQLQKLTNIGPSELQSATKLYKYICQLWTLLNDMRV